jgi:hypothetical protein
MTDFEKIKTALIEGGYKLNQHIEIDEFKEKKFIYLSHSKYDAPDTCFEFDGKGKLLEIN